MRYVLCPPCISLKVNQYMHANKTYDLICLFASLILNLLLVLWTGLPSRPRTRLGLTTHNVSSKHRIFPSITSWPKIIRPQQVQWDIKAITSSMKSIRYYFLSDADCWILFIRWFSKFVCQKFIFIFFC